METGTTLRYSSVLTWEGDRGGGTSGYAAYDRRFRVAIPGKADLVGSADPVFRGDADLHNPEDLMLAAVAACHMLFYLSLCARAGLVVLRYEDTPAGTLAVAPAGGGRFEEIALRPRVTLARGGDPVAARALHVRAGELCFIANSCRFPIRHEPEVQVEQVGRASDDDA